MDKKTVNWLQQRVRQRRIELQNAGDNVHNIGDTTENLSTEEAHLADDFRTKVKTARERRHRKLRKNVPEESAVISQTSRDSALSTVQQHDVLDKSRASAFKERIKDRIQQAKEKAAKGRIETQTTEDITDENASPKQTPGRRKRLKNLWQTGIGETIRESQEDKERASFESSYDFFTRVWDPEDEEDNQKQNDHDNSHSIDIEDTDELLDNEFRVEDWVLVRQTKADYIPFEEWKCIEKQLYFIPSSGKVPLMVKMGNERCNLEDEGFYVGVRPDIPEKNINRIESRFLRQNELNWFGDDGQVKMLPLPVRSGYCRPTNLMDQDVADNVVICKAELFSDNLQQLRKDGGVNQLDIDVAALFFKHHPLFSREHVLTSRLQTLLGDYNRIQDRDALTLIMLRIKSLKSTLEHLNQTEVSSEQDVRSREQRVAHYRQEIRRLRQARDKVESELRSLLKSILGCWSAIKRLRDENGFTCTNVKLLIHKEESSRDTDEREWNEQIQEELEEMAQAHEAEYSQSIGKYEAEVEKWKQLQKSRRQATKRQKRREQSEGSSAAIKELDDTYEHDYRILRQEPMPEPNPPPKFDPEEALQTIQDKALKIRRKPGEPKLTFEINHSESITPKDQCPQSEQRRRADVQKRKIFIKIYFNDKEVCQTSSRQLSQDFLVVWAEIFRLWIHYWPQSLCLKIFESVGLTTTTPISETYWPIPDTNFVSGTVPLDEQEFSSEQVVTCRHEGVGSGLQQSFMDGDSKPQWLLTGGVLRCGVAWGVGSDGQSLAPKTEHQSEKGILSSFGQAVRKVNLTGLSDVNQLKKWLDECHLDPNDPENTHILETLEHLELVHGGDGIAKEHGVFRLDPMQEEFDFTTEAEIDNNSRFRLLRLRAQENNDFRNYQMVPVNEKEIPLDVVDRLWRKEGTVDVDVQDASTRSQKTLHFMKQVREEVLRHFLSAHHERTLEDMVMEEKVPSIGSLGFNLLRLLQKRRPLRPTRKQRKKMTSQGMTNTEVKLVVMVMRAANVPVRAETDALKNSPGRSISPSGTSFEAQVRPFVEVMFQRETRRTHVAEGPHPTWNQELHLPFKAPNDDYLATSLEKVGDIIYLNLFDEVLVDLLEDKRDRENTVHQKMERRWLGSIKIPFSTLYLNSKIEGTFCVNVPPVLLGYEQEEQHWIPSGVAGSVSSHTYLSVYLTLEPSLQLPEVLREKRTTDQFLRHAEEWQQELTRKFPQRPIKSIALDMNASWVFIPRYLRPLEPPDDLIEPDSSRNEERLARFVSLIPTTPDKIVYPGVCDVWTTCDQFLQLLTGDEEEHAILLCNFFLSLGKRAFLLMGAGIPEGATAYVLTIEGSGREVRIWNATTGDSFGIHESHIPLHTIGCLVNPDNIWANVQRHDHPSNISFDLSNTKHWQPYFSRKHRNPGFASIQPEKLMYVPTSRRYVDELEEKIENTLRESLMRWRKRFRTSWNRFCIQALRKVLSKLEENRKGSVEPVHELEQILASHKMCGFPLNMPFTTIDTILDTVFATGVHLAEGKDLEFALAIYLHPYPCSVISVWVYVATLVRRR